MNFFKLDDEWINFDKVLGVKLWPEKDGMIPITLYSPEGRGADLTLLPKDVERLEAFFLHVVTWQT